MTYDRRGQLSNVEEESLASDISYKEQYFWVANRRLSTLIAFALEVGQQKAATREETELVACLRKEEHETLFPGCSFDLSERFPTLASKKFWARIFYDVARRIFLRQLGNQEIDCWQASAIGDAYLIARMLTHAIRDEEPNWIALSEDVRLDEDLDGGPINVRL